MTSRPHGSSVLSCCPGNDTLLFHPGDFSPPRLKFNCTLLVTTPSAPQRSAGSSPLTWREASGLGTFNADQTLNDSKKPLLLL